MKIFRNLISALTASVMLCTGTLTAGAEEYNGFVYKNLYIQELIITDYNGNAEELEVPYQINSVRVTTLADGLFEGSSVKRVTLPDTLVEVSCRCFKGSKVEYVKIGAEATIIEEEAFADCSALRRVIFTGHQQLIRADAFRNCTSLLSVRLPETLYQIGENAFSGCTSLTKVTIPKHVSIISQNAFSGCTSLKEVTVLNSDALILFHALGYDDKGNKTDGFTIICTKGSSAEKYAIDNGFNYKYNDIGDVNEDGKITADDAVITARMAAGCGDYIKKYSVRAADIDQNGKVTADDAVIIARIAAGSESYQKYIG